MYDDTTISDEDFLKVSPEDVMREIDKQVESYGQSQQSVNEPSNVEPAQDTYTNQNPNGVPQEQQQVEGQSDNTSIDPRIAEEAYRFIMEPFKASGREFQLKDFHDARTLMQQGIDYTRKQQKLKPRLIEMRTLESNGMLGDNLNYAIDLFQGKPEAIKKLIQDKKIDVNSLVSKTTDEWGNPVENQENNNNYVPTNHRMSEQQYDARETIERLSQSPQYSKMVNYINSLDQNSILKFYEKPAELEGLMKMMEDGFHDKVIDALTYARSVDDSSIRGLDDHDAYEKIGMALLNQNKPQPTQTNQQYIQQPQTQQQQYVPPYQPNNQSQQYSYQQQAVQQRKQSVSPIRNNGNAYKPKYDPLSCSDADFAKIDLNELLRM